MPAASRTDQLLRRVRTRLKVRKTATRAFWALVVFSVLYIAALLTGRLTGLFAEWFPLESVLVVPGLALLTAMLIPSRITQADAARAADRHADTRDLFLTWTYGDESVADYLALVDRDAERQAAELQPAKVTPYQWEHPALVASGTMAALLLAAWLVPTLDPFGQAAAAKEVEETHKLLKATREASQSRKEQLARKDVEGENSAEVDQALEKLQTAFQKMQPQDPQANLQKLNAHQKEIGEMYRKIGSGELKSLFEKSIEQQQLGQLHDQDLFQSWQKELQEGSSESLQEQVEQIKQAMNDLAAAKDPLERSELERKIQKQLKELSDFADRKAGSKALSAALERAMEQAKAARQDKLSKEAMDALEESLELAAEEMKMLSQSARDLKDLEEALKLISMAKQCKGECPGDGEMADQDLALSDYAKLYMEMMGTSQGMRGEREEGGPPVDEDDSIATEFKDEKSKSAIQKGKILMSLKTKGLSDSGEMKDENYQRVVGEIKQSLDDVINQEEIPPGYVEGIKKYFDRLEKE